MHSNEKKMVEIRRSPLALLLGLFYLFVAVVFAIAARKALAEPLSGTTGCWYWNTAS